MTTLRDGVPKRCHSRQSEATSANRNVHPMVWLRLLTFELRFVLMKERPERRPEVELKLPSFCQLAATKLRRIPRYGSGPVIRLGNDVELWCCKGFSNPPRLNLQSEKSKRVVGYLVQPV